MDINATLIGQMITFVVFVIFTMKYVWPPITKAMQEREKKIADGLAAAERGERNLELARDKSVEILQEAKLAATHIIDQAHTRAAHVIDEAKEIAKQESERLIDQAKSEIDQQFNQAKRQLHHETTQLAFNIAEKIVEHDIDPSIHKKLLDKIVAETYE